MDLLFPTLFAKVSVLLALTMATAALGTYLGRGIRSFVAFIVLLVLFMGGCLGVFLAAHASPELGVAALLAWGFVTGLFMGPAIETYAEDLGWQTVFGAFAGTAGVMALCGGFGLLSGIDFSHMGFILGIALFGLIIFGLIRIFVRMSREVNMGFAALGMIVFAGYFVFDFFWLGQSENTWEKAIGLTVSIFLDFVNFFLYALQFLAAAKKH
ncbi:MAG: Bax inhibitor-1 family protein [Candidatus Obscuribacterales bacterium]|nr:Bax inhibitor-1 family protein [Candidatus Obscuribacterales bacterium]